ncbi:hypothetical protein [Streptomyces sp. NPDC048338]|uniref:hypothetical protein n=1 Tax=Streptomyces sp. NPDC048338 TaxID=3365536 RepID=UPI00371764C9
MPSTFRRPVHLPATFSQEAEERYLMGAGETSSETVAPHIDSTARLDPELV